MNTGIMYMHNIRKKFMWDDERNIFSHERDDMYTFNEEFINIFNEE
jgi:hypothetical protein